MFRPLKVARNEFGRAGHRSRRSRCHGGLGSGGDEALPFSRAFAQGEGATLGGF